jgi:MFS family permease
MLGVRRRSTIRAAVVDGVARNEAALEAPAVDGAGDGAAVADTADDAPAPRRRRFAAVRESLGIRDFRFLFFSSISSGYAQWAQQIGVGLLVLELTDSASQLAAVIATGGVVRLVAGPFVGALLDRYPRRQVLIHSTWLSGAKGIGLAALVLSGYAEIWHLYVFMALDGVVSTVNQVARQAFVYDVTTDATLPNAVALNAIAQNLSRITGPVLAAALVGFLGTGYPFVVLGILHLLGTLLTLPISHVTRQQRGVSVHPLRGPWEGFLYVKSERPLLGLMLLGVVPALMVYPYVSLLPVFSKDVLDAGGIGYGLMAAAIGWGSIVGLLVLALMGRDVKRKGLYAMWGMVGYAVALLAFSQSTVLPVALVLLTVAGLFHGVTLNLQQVLVQILARNDMRGRATSLFQMGFALMPIGIIPMGFAADRWGADVAFGAFFLVSTICFLLILVFWRSLRGI